MISFIDMHVMMALNEAWITTVAGGYSAFRAVFSSKLPDELFVEVWAKLQVHKPSFRSAWTLPNETDESIIIAVELLDEQPSPQGTFSDAWIPEAPGSAAPAQWNLLLSDVVAIYIYAPNKDIVRVLHTWVKASILSSKAWLFGAGADNIMYTGAKDMGPESRLLPDGTTAYLRMQQWSFAGAEELHRVGGAVAATPRWITVSDRVNLVGAVRDTENRTVTPLEDTLPGGLDPD